MDFAVEWENQELEQDEYLLEMKATAKGEQWNWNHPFEIKEDRAKELNEEAVSPFVNGGYSIVIPVLLGIIFWLSRKNRKAANYIQSLDGAPQELEFQSNS